MTHTTDCQCAQCFRIRADDVAVATINKEATERQELALVNWRQYLGKDNNRFGSGLFSALRKQRNKECQSN